jgi:hypothetical protein
MYYSMPINMFFIVKNHWQPYFTDNPRTSATDRSHAAEEVLHAHVILSDQILEQGINIEFCVKVGNTASETLAYGEYAMKESAVFELRRQFKELR